MFETVDSLLKQKLPPVHTLENSSLIDILLYGHETLKPFQNKGVLNVTIDYIRTTERFG